MSNSSLPPRPWRDLRWWVVVFGFIILLCWLFLYFQQAGLLVKLVEVAVTILGGLGLKMLLDQRQKAAK